MSTKYNLYRSPGDKAARLARARRLRVDNDFRVMEYYISRLLRWFPDDQSSLAAVRWVASHATSGWRTVTEECSRQHSPRAYRRHFIRYILANRKARQDWLDNPPESRHAPQPKEVACSEATKKGCGGWRLSILKVQP